MELRAKRARRSTSSRVSTLRSHCHHNTQLTINRRNPTPNILSLPKEILCSILIHLIPDTPNLTLQPPFDATVVSSLNSTYSNLLMTPTSFSTQRLVSFCNNLLSTFTPILLTCRTFHIAVTAVLAPFTPLLLLIPSPLNNITLNCQPSLQALQIAVDNANAINIEITYDTITGRLPRFANQGINFNNGLTRYASPSSYQSQYGSNVASSSQNTIANHKPSPMLITPENFHEYISLRRIQRQQPDPFHLYHSQRQEAVMRIMSRSMRQFVLPECIEEFLCIGKALCSLPNCKLEALRLPRISNLLATGVARLKYSSLLRQTLSNVFTMVSGSLKELHVSLPDQSLFESLGNVQFQTLKSLTVRLTDETVPTFRTDLLDYLLQQLLAFFFNRGIQLRYLTIMDPEGYYGYAKRMPDLKLNQYAPFVHTLTLQGIQTVDRTFMDFPSVQRLVWKNGSLDFGRLDTILRDGAMPRLRQISVQGCKPILPEVQMLQVRGEGAPNYQIPIISIAGPLIVDLIQDYTYDHVVEDTDFRYITIYCHNLKRLQICICDGTLPALAVFLDSSRGRNINTLDLWLDGDEAWWHGHMSAIEASRKFVHELVRSRAPLINLGLRSMWLTSNQIFELISRFCNVSTMLLSMFEPRALEEGDSGTPLDFGDVAFILNTVAEQCKQIRWFVIQEVDMHCDRRFEQEIPNELQEEIATLRSELPSFTFQFWFEGQNVCRVLMEKRLPENLVLTPIPVEMVGVP